MKLSKVHTLPPLFLNNIFFLISFHCSISTYHISGSSSAGTHTHYLYINSFNHTMLLTVLIFAEGGKPENPEKTLVA